jgi:hypothetical protein
MANKREAHLTKNVFVAGSPPRITYTSASHCGSKRIGRFAAPISAPGAPVWRRAAIRTAGPTNPSMTGYLG